MKKLIALCLSLACGMVLGGKDAVWSNLDCSANNAKPGWDDAANKWGCPGNWTDASGQTLTVAPTNAADQYSVSFAALPTTGGASETRDRRYVHTGRMQGTGSDISLGDYAADPSVDSVTGSDRYTIIHAAPGAKSQVQSIRSFAVRDPNGFAGFWELHTPLSEYLLTAGVGFSPMLQNLGVRYRARLNVATAGVTAKVGALYDEGVLDKVGAGNVEIGSSSGDGTIVLASAGGVTVDGTDEADVEAVLDMAYLHLDASAPNAFTYQAEPSADGRTYVTEWKDVRGNGQYAYTSRTVDSGLGKAHSPFVSAEKSPTGLTFLDFGARIPEDVAMLGPTNCCMTFPVVRNVKEYFYVAYFTCLPGNTAVLSSTSSYPLHRGGERLYDENADLQVRGGDLMFNGMHVDADEVEGYNALTNLFVASGACFADGAGIMLNVIGSDRTYAKRTGGMRVGEVLIFTNFLTRAERLAIHRRLNVKWRTGDRGDDVGGLVVQGGTGVTVPADRTAKIGLLRTTTGTVAKRGEGVLQIGAVVPAGAKVEVSAGSVSFAPESVDASAPAAEPFLWLDATKASSFVYSDADKKIVSQWKDWRSTVDRLAKSGYETDTQRPTVITDPKSGLAAVSTGNVKAGNGAWFKLPTWKGDPEQQYSGFAVFRQENLDAVCNIFGASSGLIFMRDGFDTLLSTSYRTPEGSSLTWTVNGEPVDPWHAEKAFLKQTNEFIVVGFSGPFPLTWQSLSADRGTEQPNKVGNGVYGEVLGYVRELTVAERRQTEAYLMRKWLGKAHPLAAERSGTVSFAENVAAQVDAATDAAIALAGGNGTFVKSGKAKLAATVGLDFASDEVSVAQGTLVLDYDRNADDYAHGARFHFDASRLDSFEYYVETQADGTAVTNLTYWHDLSGNGLVAQSTYTKHNPPFEPICLTNPTLRTVTMPDGAQKPAVCFGARKNCAREAVAGLLASSFDLSERPEVREVFSVYSDYDANSHGDYVGTKEGTRFLRDGWGMVSTSYGAADVVNGYLAVDGTNVTATTDLQKPHGYGFHVVSICPLSKQMMGTIMRDRDCNAGGGYMAEQLAFTNELTSAERRYIEYRLMDKWFGTSQTRVTRKVVAFGAASRLETGTFALFTESLSLAGEASFVGGDLVFADGAELNVTIDDKGNVATLSADSHVTFEGAVFVKLTVSDLTKVSKGRYVILSGEAFAGVDLSKWTVDISSLQPRIADAKLSLVGNSIVLDLVPSGMLIMLR